MHNQKIFFLDFSGIIYIFFFLSIIQKKKKSKRSKKRKKIIFDVDDTLWNLNKKICKKLHIPYDDIITTYSRKMNQGSRHF